MTTQLTQQISAKTKEIYNLEVKLQALQVAAQTAPVADHFDSQQEFLEATRNYHQSERDRLDELASIQAYLPPTRAKLKELQDLFDGIKSPVEQHFEELAAAALEVNKIFEEAEKACERVFEMAKKQSELGHQTVFGTMPLTSVLSPDFPIFCVSSNKISMLKRQQYRDYLRNGNVSAGVRV